MNQSTELSCNIVDSLLFKISWVLISSEKMIHCSSVVETYADVTYCIIGKIPLSIRIQLSYRVIYCFYHSFISAENE